MDHRHICCALALLALVASPARADDTHVELQIRGAHVEAELTWSEGCVQGWLWLGGGETVRHESGGAPVETALTFAYYNTMNLCTGEVVRAWGTAESSPAIDRLDGATIALPMTMGALVCRETERGYVCDTLPTGEIAMLEVTFVGEGSPEHGLTITQSSSAGVRTRSREMGTTRQARVEVTMRLGGADLVEGWVTSRATIASIQSGSRTIDR